MARRPTRTPRLTAAALRARAARIRCLFLDVDGVITDCKLYLNAAGEELKAVHVRDGLGMKMFLKAGLEIAVISGRPSIAMEKRCAELGIRHVFLATPDKVPAYEAVQRALGLSDAQCAVMGDDVPDLPLMQRAGLALTVADSHPTARGVAHWVSRHDGGNGAIREAVDLILAAHGLSGAAAVPGSRKTAG